MLSGTPVSTTGLTFHVVDDATANISYQYTASGGAQGTTSLAAANAAPRGAASVTAMDKTWVIDANRNVYVYNTSGTLLGSWSAGTMANMAASIAYSNALDSSSLPLLIGRRNSGDARDFSVDGRIDDVAIWNRPLSTAEITTLWNGGAGSSVLPAVPEPSTFVMSSMLFGMLCTGWFRKLMKQTPTPA
jgi:hypothetical protein